MLVISTRAGLSGGWLGVVGGGGGLEEEPFGEGRKGGGSLSL